MTVILGETVNVILVEVQNVQAQAEKKMCIYLFLKVNVSFKLCFVLYS